MRRLRLVLVLFVLVTVLTAGCLGGGGSANGGDGTTSPNGDDTNDSNGDDTNGDDTNGDDAGSSDDGETAPENGDDESTDSNGDDPAAEPGENGADTPDDDSSDEATDEGSSDDPDEPTSDAGEWTVVDPEDPLSDAGSYTNTWTWRSGSEGSDAVEEIVATTLVDANAARSSSTMRVVEGDEVSTTENFYADGQQYTRFASGDGADEGYFVVDAEFDDAGMFLDYGNVYDVSDLSEWSAQGTETYDGVTVQRYVYDGPDYWTDFDQGSGSEEFDARESTLELLVDGDGIARSQSYRIEGVDETGAEVWFEWEYTLTGIGTTTVDDPPWLEDALSASN